MKEHDPSCPKAQFWDAGEWEARCNCGGVTKLNFEEWWDENQPLGWNKAFLNAAREIAQSAFAAGIEEGRLRQRR